MRITSIFLFISLLISCTGNESTNQTYQIGQQSFNHVDEERNRPLDVEIWYPTYDDSIPNRPDKKTLFKPLLSIPNAKPVPQKFPLLLVSHGTGGNRFSLTWLVERMVKRGYIVMSVGHYGNTTFNKKPREFVKWWERAVDIQFILDQILENKEFNSIIDADKIGGVGFSLGGYTNIALAGGLVDRTYHEGDEDSKKRALPPEFPQTDEVIDFDTDSLIVASYEKYKNKLKDDRIKAFFVMAPAIGFGFHSKEQTQQIQAPIFIVAGKGDTNTPIEFNALNYHQLIPTSEIHLLGENVDHYVFLNEATDFGKEVAPQIAIDNEGVNRQQIHDEVSDMVMAFFEKHFNQ